MSENLRPARHACERTGVLEFHVWEASPGGDTVLTIIGPHTWRRPITGENRDGELIVKSEGRFNGDAARVSDYLAAVFGELSGYVATHSARYFSVRLGGPLSEAPRIRKWVDHRQADPSACRC